MKRLSDLLERIKPLKVVGSADREVEALSFDSREVGEGYCFFAVRGTQSDGHNYIASAIESGALAVVCQELPQQLNDEVCYIVVEDSNKAMADMAAAFYDYPSEELELVGVTGTNGKTTVATLLCDLFQLLGHKAGLISTVVYRVGEREIASTHTTPDAIRLNAMLREMVNEGCDYCFMEVSSHSVVQERIRGLKFAGGIFTNLTHDHLDYHGTFAEYIKAKRLFFDSLPKRAFALTNIDDRNGEVMVQNAVAKVSRYSLRSMADFRCKVLEMLFDGMLLDVCDREVWVQLLGRFNAYNLLAVYGTATLLGKSSDEVLQAMSALRKVNGRFEPMRSESGITAIVDYAHTPDALVNVLDTINEVLQGRGQCWTVCGAGGNRDKGKRPLMAQEAAKNSDRVILTSDNPRNEDPQEIINDMLTGLDAGQRRSVICIVDRREAIRTACTMAQPGDVILVAGKGHEDYQIIQGVKHHFDDHEVIREAFGLSLG